MVTKKTYRVLNPRNIEPHIRIFYGEYQGVSYEWYQGDVFDPPPGMLPGTVGRLQAEGFIEDVSAELETPAVEEEPEEAPLPPVEEVPDEEPENEVFC